MHITSDLGPHLMIARTGKVWAAPKAKPASVNAIHAFYHGEEIGTEHPDHNTTQHTSRVSLPITTCIWRVYACMRATRVGVARARTAVPRTVRPAGEKWDHATTRSVRIRDRELLRTSARERTWRSSQPRVATRLKCTADRPLAKDTALPPRYSKLNGI